MCSRAARPRIIKAQQTHRKTHHVQVAHCGRRADDDHGQGGEEDEVEDLEGQHEPVELDRVEKLPPAGDLVVVPHQDVLSALRGGA